ncbi:hypothetical protein AB9F38_35090, partial [Rhizobium leguminosarum]
LRPALTATAELPPQQIAEPTGLNTFGIEEMRAVEVIGQWAIIVGVASFGLSDRHAYFSSVATTSTCEVQRNRSIGVTPVMR